jgi:hypothetical protein
MDAQSERCRVVADIQRRERQWWLLDAHQLGPTVLRGSFVTRPEPQSRTSRMFDGISSRLDSVRWPSLLSQAQEAWEPARTVTGRQPYRNQRLSECAQCRESVCLYAWENQPRHDRAQRHVC